MATESGVESRSASPWPIFVAVGAVTAEIGVLFGFAAVAVGGVLLFGSCCAGVLRDAGYAESVWPPLRFVGVTIGGAGALVWALRATAFTPGALRGAAASDPFAARAAVVLGAAVVLVGAGIIVPVATGR